MNVLQYPDGYLEKEAEKRSEKEKKEQKDADKTPVKKNKTGAKRKRVIESDDEGKLCSNQI